MFDVVEIRNLNGEKINIHLEENKSGVEDLGEWFAQIRIGQEPYLLVAESNQDRLSGDIEGRTWGLVHVKSITFPDSFFEQENIPWVMQMITPFLGESKLNKIQKILEEKDE